jgi:hypothetical protein
MFDHMAWHAAKSNKDKHQAFNPHWHGMSYENKKNTHLWRHFVTFFMRLN